VIQTRTLAATLLVSVAMLPVTAFAAGPPTFSNPQPVIVTNPPNQGSNTFIVNPADIANAIANVGTPVAFRLTLDNVAITVGAPYTVPANQRLVIEYISGNCGVFDASITELQLRILAPGPVQLLPPYHIISSPTSTLDSTAVKEMTFNYLAKIYVVSGSTINLESVGGGLGTSSPFLQCDVTVTGQLINN